MQDRSIDELLDVTVERSLPEQLLAEVGCTIKDGSEPVCPVMTGNTSHTGGRPVR